MDERKSPNRLQARWINSNSHQKLETNGLWPFKAQTCHRLSLTHLMLALKLFPCISRKSGAFMATCARICMDNLHGWFTNVTSRRFKQKPLQKIVKTKQFIPLCSAKARIGWDKMDWCDRRVKLNTAQFGRKDCAISWRKTGERISRKLHLWFSELPRKVTPVAKLGVRFENFVG